ncbi:MAG: hypothetical protein D6718_13845, partial [Acidobacteria bacterium]
MRTKTTFLVTLLLTPFFAPAPAAGAASAPAAESIRELRDLLARGDCDTVLDRVSEMRRSAPRHPDLLALEANCRMREDRVIERRFDEDMYERLILGTGRDSLPARAKQLLERVDVRFSRKSVRRASELFLQAVEAAPYRADIVVGATAALVDMGEDEAARDVLAEHSRVIDAGAARELDEAAGDFLRTRRLERAAAFAEILRSALPRSPLGPALAARVHLARFRAVPAIEELERAVELDPSNLALREELVRLLIAARRFDRAFEAASSHAVEDLSLAVSVALTRSHGRIVPAGPI